MALCILVATVNLHSYAQGNVGINSDATRARFEVNGAGLGGYTSALFGTEGVGVSFQKRLANCRIQSVQKIQY